MAIDGLKTVSSHLGVKETMDRLEAEVKARGLTAFARVDHATGAAAVGMSLRPTELLLFAMREVVRLLCKPIRELEIDLPLKALAYEDDVGRVWLS